MARSTRSRVSADTATRVTGPVVEGADLTVGPEPAPASLQVVDPVPGLLGQAGRATHDDDVGVGAHGPEPEHLDVRYAVLFPWTPWCAVVAQRTLGTALVNPPTRCPAASAGCSPRLGPSG